MTDVEWCQCAEDAEGNLIPDESCPLHWHHVITEDEAPPAVLYP
jgi:hypothetical protein